jgi:methionyl-tRNA formyltransferase
MRVIFFGALCTFSTAPLQRLLEAGHDVCAVMFSSGRSIGGRRSGRPSP